MAFNLADVLKDVSNLDTGREQIEYIPLSLIDADPNNFYQLTDLDQLASNIELCGLQQPIRVRRNPEDMTRYMIVSGHRRRAAIEILAESDPDRWKDIPCIVEQDTVSPSLQQLRLIYANSGTRKLTSAELDEQAVQVEKLLYQLKEEGYDFPGRMRDHVAEAVNASKTKLARLKVIRENLSELWMPSYRAGDLPESTAYTLAQMPKEWQKPIWQMLDVTRRSAKYLTEREVAMMRARMEGVAALTCPQDGAPCANAEQKCQKIACSQSWQSGHCVACCAECGDLTSCKYACPKLKQQIKQMKSEAREKWLKEQAEEKARILPTVEYIQGVYQRVGNLRTMKNIRVEQLYKAEGKYFCHTDREKQQKLELGHVKITEVTPLPFGHGFYYSDAKSICNVADLLGCTVDYLLGRTEEPVPDSDTTPTIPEGAIPCYWYPASVEPPVCEDLIIYEKDGFVDTGRYLGSGELDDSCIGRWKDAKYWTTEPKEACPPPETGMPADWLPLKWIPGHENPPRPMNAVAYFQVEDAGEHTTSFVARWDGSRWLHRNRTPVDARCVKWFPVPDE